MHAARPALLALSLVLLLPAAAGAEYGVHELDGGATIEVPGERTSYWICVAADEAGEVVLEQTAADGAVVARHFEPAQGEPDCRTLPGGALRLANDTSGPVRVLVLVQPPREATSPGVVRLVGAGTALQVPRVAEDTEIGVLIERAGTTAVVVATDTYAELRVFDTAGEGRHAPGADAASAAGVIVLVAAAGDEGSVLVDWADPTWYPTRPSIGHIAVVVVAALLIILFHGRSPRDTG